MHAARAMVCVHDGEDLVDTERDPWIGRPLDRYRLEERLGTGGMGCVYRGRHTVLDREYAIKVLFADFGQDERFLARFKREAQAMSRVRHDNIVHVEDFGTTPDGTTFLVMELVGGRTLERLIAEEAPFTVGRASHLTRQIVAGLGAAHEGGFVHRDVKPSNVMVDDGDGEERVKMLDFGAVSLRALPRNERLTHVGHIIGTPTYMAPEQSQDPNVGPTADLYAVGVVLFEMLTGHPPFDGPDRAQILVKHITAPPPAAPPSKGLERLVAWLLEKHPSARPQSAEQVQAFLDQISGDLEATAVTNVVEPGRAALPETTPVETPPTRTDDTPQDDLRALYRDLTDPVPTLPSRDEFPALDGNLDWAQWSDPGVVPLSPTQEAAAPGEAHPEATQDDGHAATQIVRERVTSSAEFDATDPAELYRSVPAALTPPGESDDGGPTQVDFDVESLVPITEPAIAGAGQKTAPARAVTQARPPIEHLGLSLDDPATLLEEDDEPPEDLAPTRTRPPRPAPAPVAPAPAPAGLPSFNLSAGTDTVSPPHDVHEPWLGEPSSRSAPPLVVPAEPQPPRLGRTLYYVAIGGLTLLIGVLAFILWTGQRTIDLGEGAEPAPIGRER